MLLFLKLPAWPQGQAKNNCAYLTESDADPASSTINQRSSFLITHRPGNSDSRWVYTARTSKSRNMCISSEQYIARPDGLANNNIRIADNARPTKVASNFNKGSILAQDPQNRNSHSRWVYSLSRWTSRAERGTLKSGIPYL